VPRIGSHLQIRIFRERRGSAPRAGRADRQANRRRRAPACTAPSTWPTANFDNPVHLNSDKLKFQTKDPTDVRIQKLVFGAGNYSGWHHHPGTVLVAVESGAVTLLDSDCNSKTYGPGLPDGAVFAEDGDDPVRATSTNGATV
jgi:hypothetical protein